MIYSLSCIQAKQILEALANFEKITDIFLDKNKVNEELINQSDLSENIDKYKALKQGLNCLLAPISYYTEIYKKMETRFRYLSEEQICLYYLMKNIQELIEKNKILEYIENIIEGNTESNTDINDSFLQDIIIKIKNYVDKVKDLLLAFINITTKWYQIQKYYNIFYNDLLGSLNQTRVELSDFFDYDEYTLKTSDFQKIDYIIIKGKKLYDENNKESENIEKKLMIICGPNGSPFEYFSKNIQLDTYLNKGIDVLCWNYRGYGYSTGTATIEKMKLDILELFDYVDKSNKYNKYGVHGISLGGVPSCCLALNRSKVKLLICDRNFGDIDSLTISFSMGNIIYYLYQLLVIPSSYNVRNYIHTPCYKIILNDPLDNIVLENASLKTMLSNYILNRLIYKNDNDEENINASSSDDNNEGNILFILIL